MMYQQILDEIFEEIQPYLDKGQVADYIPCLANVPASKFAMSIRTVEGECYSVGHALEKFSIQSISKLFVLTLAMKLSGEDIWSRVSREPSGTPFNSLIQLESEDGIPRNPFINAGALVMTDEVLSKVKHGSQYILDFVRGVSGDADIDYDHTVAHSEQKCGYRNAALANFIKSFGNLNNDVQKVLETYYLHCSLSMTCEQLTKAFMFLANGGHSLSMQDPVLTASQTKRINAIMLTCGVYDEAGDFAYNVGLPGKSGVGGGIVAIIPNKLCVSVWSPGLNHIGNSLAGSKALELFTTKTKISVF